MKKFITSLFLSLGLGLALSASAAPAAPPTAGLNSFGAAVSNPLLTKDQAPLESIPLRGKSRPNLKVFGFTRNADGVIRSMTADSESRKVRANADEETSCTAYLNVDVEGFRYLRNCTSISPALIDKKTGAYYFFELPSENWFFDAPMICEDVPPGEYAAYVELDLIRTDYTDDGKRWITYAFNFADITVVPDAENLVTVKMSDAVNTLEYRALNDEGVPFPYYEEPDNLDDYQEPEEVPFTFPHIYFEYWGFGNYNYGNSRVLFMVPDLDEKCMFGVSGNDYFQSSPVIYAFSMSKRGPITGDLVLSNDPADYKYYNARYDLTPEDLKCPVRGAGYVNWTLNKIPDGLSFYGSSANGGAFGGNPFNSTDLRVCWQEDNPDVILSGWSPETRSQWDSQVFKGEMKVAGVYVPDADGNIIITGTSYYRKDNGEYTFISPIDIFNINPDKTEIVNFRQSLFLSGHIDWYIDENGKILSFSPTMSPTGYNHESINCDDSEGWIKEVRLNGKKVRLNSLYSKYLAEGDVVEVDLAYDNVMVEEKFSTEALLTVGIKYGGEDVQAPYLTDFMVALEDGTPTCRVPIDGANGAAIHLIAKDNSDNDLTVGVAVAEQESDEWREVSVTPQKINDQLGSYVSVPLAEMAHDKWYKVKVTATDRTGNFSIATINYAFIVSNESGIGTVATDGASGCEPVYYNLQGARVTNPASGLYIRLNGNKAEKVLLK